MRRRINRAALVEGLEFRRLLATITVTSTADSVTPGDGAVTLREAITAMNSFSSTDPDITAQNPGTFGTNDTIDFNISGSEVHTIEVGSDPTLTGQALPELTDFNGIKIDGFSQPGASPNTLTNGASNANTLIQIDGAQAVAGSEGLVATRFDTIRGLIITGFRGGTTINSFGDSGGDGITLTQFFNHIEGNIIGNAQGIAGAANLIGVSVLSSQNFVGGLTPDTRNVISGNASEGVLIQTSYTVVQNNLIGTDLTGTQDRGNGNDGVEIFAAAQFKANPEPAPNQSINNIIGVQTSGQGNVIAFNHGHGISVDLEVPEGGAGLSVLGVETGNVIRKNSIFDNGQLGIALTESNVDLIITLPEQPTTNDAGDADPGPNDVQNYPFLASAVSTSAGTTVNGTFNSTYDTAYVLDFYSSPTPDPTGFGEGKTYLGSLPVTTDSSGNAIFTATLPAVAGGDVISATATVATTLPTSGDTSEFSGTVEVTGGGGGTVIPPPTPPTISIGDVSMNEGNSGTTAFTFTITRSGDLSGASSVQYATADGTATTADSDYQSQSNTIAFDPNQASKTITILVNGDTKFEADETFTVNLSTPTGAAIADAAATGTIVNDDPPPTISIGNVSMKEGNSGTTEFDFPLTFSDNGPFSQNISFTVTTTDGTATVSDNDYQPVNGAGAAFLAGTNLSGKFLPVFVNGDTKVEGDETFTVTISSASGATIGNAVATGTIINDDSAPPPPPSSGSAKVVTDPCDSTKKALEIDGTDNKDTITVTKSGSSQGKAVVKINGVNKGTFSFSGSIVVYGKGGADNISIDSGITRGAYIWGGDGNDTVSGGGGNDIIFGQGNDDSINGNSGRDILVGGDGTDKLNGGPGDDLLIAGDFKSAPSMSQLCSIQKEWTRTDKTYAKRVTDLTNGGGFNSIKLNSSTLFSSTSLKDSMTGGADSDLFFAAMTGDKITDKGSSETAVNIG